jgi:hypothetical protein
VHFSRVGARRGEGDEKKGIKEGIKDVLIRGKEFYRPGKHKCNCCLLIDFEGSNAMEIDQFKSETSQLQNLNLKIFVLLHFKTLFLYQKEGTASFDRLS